VDVVVVVLVVVVVFVEDVVFVDVVVVIKADNVICKMMIFFLNVHLNKKEKVHFGSLFAKLVKKC